MKKPWERVKRLLDAILVLGEIIIIKAHEKTENVKILCDEFQ